MIKLAILALASLAGTFATADESCVLVDFTVETSEFADLNAAIDLVMSADVVDSILKKYDPLILSDVAVGNFSYSLLGQDLTITPTINSLKVTGLTTIAPQHVNVTSSNSVDVGAYSEGQVSVDATLTLEIKELDASATVQLALVLEKPTLMANIEANIYACAPGGSTSMCSNMTVKSIETEVVSAAVGGSYVGILEEVLMKFKDASVKSFTLDFDLVSSFHLNFDSSSSVFASFTSLLSDYSADAMNKKVDVYDSVISKINDEVPGLLNELIDSKLKSWFGATCLPEN
ncbi:hypothetical protein PHYPSEUDO_009435 [Phytophthora pseudosyringae]|uniref:Uncharacterized protein n=1 Tax=Phytophthora pseudosyringae TaxID=221518 RepID=A0A8T1VHC7_9STRA|nr:hypothetical protein PHYPSEUDO_009435 [Phytophthora pseudosyringae]